MGTAADGKNKILSSNLTSEKKKDFFGPNLPLLRNTEFVLPQKKLCIF